MRIHTKAFAIGAVALAWATSLYAVTPAAPAANPDVLSVRFVHEDDAFDFLHDARSHGERVCLTEMRDGGAYYWLHTCEER